MAPIVLGLGVPSEGEPITKTFVVAANEDSASAVRSATYRGTNEPLYWHVRRTLTPTNTNLRFTGVDIPRNATILSAKITIYSRNAAFSVTEDDYVTIGAEQVDNASAITNYADHISRCVNVGTTARWQLPTPSSSDLDIDISPDLAAVVQQIVNRPGWPDGSGGAIQFFAESNATGVDLPDPQRHSRASAPSSDYYPSLEVTYSV